MMPSVLKRIVVLTGILAVALAVASAPAFAAGPKSAKVDINSATEKELEALPGVGTATAKKIIAGRPYSSVADLSKAGLSESLVKKLTPLVTAGSAPAAAPPKEEKPAKAPKEEKAARAPEEKKAPAMVPAGAKVDLNTASQKELEALPGVGEATAKKIIAGRPYSSAADLARAGVPAKTVDKISPLVTVSAKAAPPPAAAERAAAPSSKPAAASKSASSGETSAPAVAPPSKGMVWVNTETKVFHREGDKWYGNTKHGKYMTETEALQAGYRESKQHQPKK